MDLQRSVTQPARGWSDGEWAAATATLVDRGWLTGDGRVTRAGADRYQEIEATTDALSAEPWHRLGRTAVDRLLDLLHPLARACHQELPAATPLGVPVPSGRG